MSRLILSFPNRQRQTGVTCRHQWARPPPYGISGLQTLIWNFMVPRGRWLIDPLCLTTHPGRQQEDGPVLQGCGGPDWSETPTRLSSDQEISRRFPLRELSQFLHRDLSLLYRGFQETFSKSSFHWLSIFPHTQRSLQRQCLIPPGSSFQGDHFQSCHFLKWLSGTLWVWT